MNSEESQPNATIWVKRDPEALIQWYISSTHGSSIDNVCYEDHIVLIVPNMDSPDIRSRLHEAVGDAEDLSYIERTSNNHTTTYFGWEHAVVKAMAGSRPEAGNSNNLQQLPGTAVAAQNIQMAPNLTAQNAPAEQR
jgi:hypothetical protein